MYDIWQIPCLLFSHLRSGLGNTSYKENHFLLGIAICQADCDDVWSDNCDYNFGTFDDFGVNNYQKAYTKHYIDVKMGQLYGGKSAKEFRSPPFSGERKRFFLCEVFPNVGDHCDLL